MSRGKPEIFPGRPLESTPRYTAAAPEIRGSRRASTGVIMVAMDNVAYVSSVRIERVKGPLRRAWLPAEQSPVLFGVHGAVAQHYKVPPDVLEPHATTLDYIVAAAAG